MEDYLIFFPFLEQKLFKSSKDNRFSCFLYFVILSFLFPFKFNIIILQIKYARFIFKILDRPRKSREQNNDNEKNFNTSLLYFLTNFLLEFTGHLVYLYAPNVKKNRRDELACDIYRDPAVGSA